MDIDDEKQKILSMIDKFERIVELVKFKNSGDELFSALIDKRIEIAKHEIDMLRKHLKEMKEPTL